MPFRHALTVDVEDWPQSTLDHALPITQRAVINTRRMLELFAKHNVRGTFFVLGRLTKKFPHLVQEIAAAGHELASHGYSHRPVWKIGPQTFTDELEYSVKMLEDISGQHVTGYRAPDFSINENALWAFDILADFGMTYDSSIVPVRMRRYGINRFPRHIHRLDNGLVEVPLSTIRVLGRRWPIAGGGYMRLYPYRVTAHAIRRLEAEGLPAVVYLHPYELDVTEVHEVPFPVTPRTRFFQGLGRKHVEARLNRLLTQFHFAPLSEVIRDHIAPPASSEVSSVPMPTALAR